MKTSSISVLSINTWYIVFIGSYTNWDLPFARNHPQMVYLYKIPSDFSMSQVRDSFMRQFSTPEMNLTVDIQEMSEENTTLVKFSPVKLVRQDVVGSKSGGAMEKRSGITLIVR